MRKFLPLVLCLVLFLALTVTVGFANQVTGGGTAGSPTFGDAHVNGSNENEENRIGFDCVGFRWNYKPVKTETVPDESANQPMEEQFIVKLANGRAICDYTVKDKAFMWAVLQKDFCDGKGFCNFSWKAWNSTLEYPCLYHEPGSRWSYMYPNGMYVEPVVGRDQGEVLTGNVPHRHDWGQIDNQILLNYATQQAGWQWEDNKGWYTRGGEHLDIVWVNTDMITTSIIIPDPPSGEFKLYLEKVTATDYNGSPKNPVFEYSQSHYNGGWDHDDTDAEWLWNNGELSCDYAFQSADGQHSYNNVVKAETIYVYRNLESHDCMNKHGGCDEDHPYWETEDDCGGHDPVPIDCYKYATKLPGPSYSRTFTYTTIQPQLRYVLFTPYNLNRNGTCIDGEFDEYGVANGPDLVMSVDNKQGIYDGQDIHMLDTNDKIPFNVTIGNDQLGIPEFGNGGWTLFDGDPGYSSSMHLEGGYTEPSTGTLMSYGRPTPGEGAPNNTQMYDITNRVSDDMHYNGSLNGKSKGMEIFSWQSNGDGLPETYSKNFNLHKLPGWRGADYDLRSIYYGQYIIFRGTRPFWEIDYTQCRYWTYGVKYSGKVQVYDSTSSNAFVRVEHPTVHERISDSSYQAQVESDFVQPFLRASFLVKTVGGNYG